MRFINFKSFAIQEGLEVGANAIQYGNSPAEFMELSRRDDDPIKNWFIQNGIFEAIVKNAPRNDSETTMNDMKILIEKTKHASGEQITFARYADHEENLANLFIDLLQQHGHSETMGEFFSADSQTESLLFHLKDVINRPRPYQLAKFYDIPLYPLIRTDAMTASYPSGHALTGFVMSEYYSRKYPEHAEELRGLGNKIAESREITGIHFPSDTAISREICKIICDNNLLIS
jgi:acid phosphatase (class A)